MTLTREQILALPPGRELDVLVCKHVLGKDEWWLGVCQKIDGISYPGSPSQDIAVAWQVFLVVMGHLFSVRKRFFDALAEQARIEAHTMPEGLWALQLLRHRFPHAVCLAALLATLEGRP